VTSTVASRIFFIFSVCAVDRPLTPAPMCGTDKTPRSIARDRGPGTRIVVFGFDATARRRRDGSTRATRHRATPSARDGARR
jgi:hypothetical protein